MVRQAQTDVMYQLSVPSFLPTPEITGKSFIPDWMWTFPFCRKGEGPRTSDSKKIGVLLKTRLGLEAK